MPEDQPHRTRYERAVKQHAGELFNYALRICGRADGAEDLVQETFLSAWRSIHTLRDENRLRAWLFAILRRQRIRSMKKHPTVKIVSLEHAGRWR
jgi:RNA polymerase sigma-70 factor (ECF subfamily)